MSTVFLFLQFFNLDCWLVLFSVLNYLSINNYFFLIVSFCFVFKKISSVYFFIYFIVYFLNYKIFNVSGLMTPVTLSIGTLLIHPCVFYSSVLCGLLSIYTRWSYIFVIQWRVILFMAICSLFLGMYWGLFSYLWGFFWVNDSVEIWLLAFVIQYALYYHMTLIALKGKDIIILSLMLGLWLFNIRLGLVWTRHSFFNTLNTYYFYIVIYSAIIMQYNRFVSIFICSCYFIVSIFNCIIWGISLLLWVWRGYQILQHLILLVVYLWWEKRMSFYFIIFINKLIYSNTAFSYLYLIYIKNSTSLLISKAGVLLVIAQWSFLFSINYIAASWVFIKSLNTAYLLFIFIVGVFILSKEDLY